MVPGSTHVVFPGQTVNENGRMDSSRIIKVQEIPKQSGASLVDQVHSTSVAAKNNDPVRGRINDVLNNLRDIVVDLSPQGQATNQGQATQTQATNPTHTVITKETNTQIRSSMGQGQGQVSTSNAGKVPSDACSLRACDQTNNCPGQNEYCYFEPECAIKTCQVL